MKVARKMTGALLASAAAGLILAGCAGTSANVASSDSGVKVTKVGFFQCSGVNACKGKSACKTANSSCKGFNSCKGKGWLPMSASNCMASNGVPGDPYFESTNQ